MDKPSKKNQNIQIILSIAAILLLFFIFFKNAWVCDDAYIIFRSVEQLHAGNGPIWNLGERVQSFTSPLWFFALSLFRFFYADSYFNAIILSFVLLIFIVLSIQKLLGWGKPFVFVLLFLSASNAFSDFTTSGLENILVYFILLMSTISFIKIAYPKDEKNIQNESQNQSQKHSNSNSQSQNPSKNTYRSFLCWSGLLFVCRHDLITLWLIPVLFVIYKYRITPETEETSKSQVLNIFKSLLFVFTPLLTWTLFSLYYYGALFPNTAYAKIFTGIARFDLLAQGVTYLKLTFFSDPITMLFIAIVIFKLLVHSKDPSDKAIGLGLVLNLLYIVNVGGDFMMGRFVSYAYLLSVILLVYKNRAFFSGDICVKYFGPRSLSILLVIYLAFYVHTPLNTGINYSDFTVRSGIADERGYFFDICSLHAYLDSAPGKVFPDYEWSVIGKQMADTNINYIENDYNGMLGFWAGTKTTIIDRLALSDPFLARLPITNTKQWRIGHFKRKVPLNYRKSIASGKNCFTDIKMKRLYDCVVDACKSKKMLSWQRFISILKLNLGLY